MQGQSLKGQQGHVAPLATISSQVLKRQSQIMAPHKPKNICSRPPPTLEGERKTGCKNLLFRVLSEERQGCMLVYLCQCDQWHFRRFSPSQIKLQKPCCGFSTRAQLR